MNIPTYATKNAVWLDMFEVIDDTLNKYPELILDLVDFIKEKEWEIINDSKRNKS